MVQASSSPRSPRSPRSQQNSPRSRPASGVVQGMKLSRGSSGSHMVVIKTPPRSPKNPTLERKSSRPNKLVLDEKDTRDSILSDRRPSEEEVAKLIKKKSSKFELPQLPEDHQ